MTEPVQLSHTRYEEEQRETHNLLRQEGPLTYQELKDSLDIEQSKMQAVIRGVLDNGIVESSLSSDGHRRYSARE